MAVMFCYNLIRERWIVFVILIEAVCMVWNAILFFRWHTAGDVFYAAYSYVMFLALVLEILIINLSMHGGEDERRTSGRNPKRPFSNLLCRLNSRSGQKGCQKVAS